LARCRKASSKATLSNAIFTAGSSISGPARLSGRPAWFRSKPIGPSSKMGRDSSRWEERPFASHQGASRNSPDRKIEIRIRERLIVEREVPPLLVVGPKAAAAHRRGEQRAVLLRLIAHARIRRP